MYQGRMKIVIDVLEGRGLDSEAVNGNAFYYDLLLPMRRDLSTVVVGRRFKVMMCQPVHRLRLNYSDVREDRVPGG
jgi:hypothetical protein